MTTASGERRVCGTPPRYAFESGRSGAEKCQVRSVHRLIAMFWWSGRVFIDRLLEWVRETTAVCFLERFQALVSCVALQG